jgi:putative DeoR family transcriptional regulator (stage III sporulation protein D)
MENSKLLEIGKMYATGKYTVRSLSEITKWSKTTIHNNLKSYKLKFLDSEIYYQCQDILEKNKQERHIRGGLATQKKYKNKINS